MLPIVFLPESPFRCCCCLSAQQQLFLMLPPFDSQLTIVKSIFCLPESPSRFSHHMQSTTAVADAAATTCCRRPCPAVAQSSHHSNFYHQRCRCELLFLSVVLFANAVPVVDACCGCRIMRCRYCRQTTVLPALYCCVGHWSISLSLFFLVVVLVVVNLVSSLSLSFAERHGL